MVYEIRAGRDVPPRRDDLADRGDHPRPGHRHAAPGRAGQDAVLARRLSSAGRSSSAGPSAPSSRGVARRRLDARSACATSAASTPWPPRNLLAYVAEEQRGHRRRAAHRPPDRRRALPRRARRLAGVHPVAVRRPGPRPVGAGHRAPDPRPPRPRGAGHLERRRHRRPPARGRRRSRPSSAVILDPTRSRSSSSSQVANSALFAARFRENAARALLLPRRRPGPRTPLWQLRQRAADLLAVASQYGSFPILLETYRECLRDVFDLPALDRR